MSATPDTTTAALEAHAREAIVLEAARLFVGADRRIAALEAELELTRTVRVQAAARLEEHTAEGEVIEWDEDGEPLVRMPPEQVGKRSVKPGGLEAHREVLEPLHLAPREEEVPPVPASKRTVYPSVADLDKRRDRLADLGVPFDELVEPKRWGPPRFLPASEAAEEARKRQEREAEADKRRRKART